MLLALFLLLGCILLIFGFSSRRAQKRRITQQAVVDIVLISGGLAYAVAWGLFPALWLAASVILARLQGRPVDNLREFMHPETSVDELAQALVVATALTTALAAWQYDRARQGRR